MAKPIDPLCPRFIGNTRLPAGKFKGRTLAEVGCTMEGLVYLYQLANSPERPSFMRPFLLRMIAEFVDHPRRQKALFETGCRP